MRKDVGVIGRKGNIGHHCPMSDQAFAEVVPFLPYRSRADARFDYEVPPALREEARRGALVVVPFRKRLLPGVVLSRHDAPAVPQTRPIHQVLLPDALPPHLLELGEWMAHELLAPIQECLRLMLPPVVRPRLRRYLVPRLLRLPDGLKPSEMKLLQLLLEHGEMEEREVQRLLGRGWRTAMRTLRRRGFLTRREELILPTMRPRFVRTVTLALPREQWAERLKGLRKLEPYRAILNFLEGERTPVEEAVVLAETGTKPSHLRMLLRRGLLHSGSIEMIRDPLADLIYTPDRPPPLLPDQAEVWQKLAAMLDHPNPRPVLLLGVTGSGKTELYLRATEATMKKGKQAIILVPERSLTPQTVRRFALRFPGKVGVWHSGMREGELYDTWRRVRAGELQVIVGARSALFTPFPRPGLIVLDEEEESSYKELQRPYYHAREVAEAMARQTGALLLLGSATPSLESYHRAQEGRYQLLRLPKRIVGHRQRLEAWARYFHLHPHHYREAETPLAAVAPLPPVQIVDLRAELKAGNRSIFSRPLQAAVDEALAAGEQVILFLNRRGTATHFFCRDCGWVATCPHCDAPLTYHQGSASLVCHRCGYHEAVMERCPLCGSRRVKAFGLGTEGLLAKVAERWPKARLMRWDQDVARTHRDHAALLSRFAAGEAEILIGTQMVARGLDLPNVTVVGVISADVGLHLPDFRAAERTFQLLAQVAGRAGRGLRGGRVIIQTYHPQHYVIRFAAAHDYEGFARYELTFRQEAIYPPYIRLARLLFHHSRAERAAAEAERMGRTLRDRIRIEGLPMTTLIGPAPAFFYRRRGRYRWQIIVRHFSPADFLRRIEFPPGWQVEIDPLDLL